MSKTYKVAVVGGHGLVAINIIRDLYKTKFPFSEIVVYGSKEHEMTPLVVDNHTFKINIIDEENIPHYDIVFFSGNDDLSYKYVDLFVAKGARIIDNSSFFRMYKKVPLVIPEINSFDLFNDSMIYANPNCIAIMVALVIYPLHKYFEAERLNVSTYQSSSGQGKRGLEEYINEQLNINYVPQVFPSKNMKKSRIFDNILPIIDNIDESSLYTNEEIKIKNETQKILHDPKLEVHATCVRVPTSIGHAADISLVCKQKIDLDVANKLLKECPYIDLKGQNDYPSLENIRGKEIIEVGRVRIDEYCEYTIHLFATSDNLVRGASYNAVMIANKLLELKIL